MITPTKITLISLYSLDQDSYGYTSKTLNPYKDDILYYPEVIDDPTFSKVSSPDEIGEQFMGDMNHPEMDDDTLRNSHIMGLRLYETEENPFPLDITKDVALAEKR